MTELLVALGLIAGVVAAHELGFWLGSQIGSSDEPFDRHVALVRTSTAALVAFLIGFAFSGAASRFIERLDIIVKEANALGTAYLRADTIPEPQRGELKGGNAKAARTSHSTAPPPGWRANGARAVAGLALNPEARGP
jgi:hypothetical protein